MALQCGIVGPPNVGKSTTFNALTKGHAPAANYPFCTIDPNVGMVAVPDERLAALAKIVNPERILPATVEFVDIAGLVKGAAQGEGLGNQFLAHIREVQAILHVVRCFHDPNIIHVSGSDINPLADIEMINTELVLADLATVEKALQKVGKGLKSGDKQAQIEQKVYEKVLLHLNAGEPVRRVLKNFDVIESLIVKNLHLLTAKPILYLANVAENGFSNNPYLDKIIPQAEADAATIIPICATVEAELGLLEDTDRQEFLESFGLKEPGLNRLIRATYDLLNLQTYFTAGVKEVRAWTIPKYGLAPQAAGVIHSDFETGFIRAEVIAYEDFINFKGEQGARAAGKLRLEGKNYIVQDGDVMHFLFNV